MPAHLVAGEEPRDEQPGHVLQQNKAERVGIRLARQLDEAIEAEREAQERLHRAALRAGEVKRKSKAEIGNERERVRRIDGERCQHREDRIEEVPFEPAEVVRAKRVGGDDHDAGLRELFAQRLPVGVLLQHKLADFDVDGAKLLGG